MPMVATEKSLHSLDPGENKYHANKILLATGVCTCKLYNRNLFVVDMDQPDM